MSWKKVGGKGIYSHVARRALASGEAVGAHAHDFYELFLVEAGAGWQRLGPQRQDLAVGDLVMVRPDDNHEICAGKDGLRILNLAFPANSARTLKARYFREDAFFFGKGMLPFVLKLDAARTRAQTAGIERLRSRPFSRLELERFLLNTFSQVLVSPAGDVAAPPWLLEARQQITRPDNFSRGASRFAELCFRSPAHVSRECLRWFNATPTELVNAERLEWAAVELALTSKEILELALECGFESLSHFYRAFSARFGLTPRRYRLREQALLR